MKKLVFLSSLIFCSQVSCTPPPHKEDGNTAAQVSPDTVVQKGVETGAKGVSMSTKTFSVPSREVRSWQAHSGGKEGTICIGDCLAFTPDGQLLASGSYDNTLKLWQVSTGQLLKTLSGHENDVWSVAFSPDGQLLASGSSDDTIKLWQVSTGQLLNTLSGHKNSVESVAFSPDGRLASGDWDGVIKLWE